MVFTGDTLFAGSVGRTDLYGKTNQPTQAEKLYSSLHEKLLPLATTFLFILPMVQAAFADTA